MMTTYSIISVFLLFAASVHGLNHLAVVGEVPYLVAIWQVMESHEHVGNDTDFQCAGVLLSSKHVLTTVNCIEQSKNGFGAVASAGFVDRGQGAATPARFHEIVEVVKHQDYDEITKQNDLAMLTVSPGFEGVDNVLPVSLAPSRTLPGAACTAAGWRLSFFYTNDSLQANEVEVLPDSACADLTTSLPDDWESLVPFRPSRSAEGRLVFGGEKLCVGQQDQQQCIVGDEGGPLVCGGQLVGLFSTYGLICLETAPEPSLYHDLDHYRDWILEHSWSKAGLPTASTLLVLLFAGVALFGR